MSAPLRGGENGSVYGLARAKFEPRPLVHDLGSFPTGKESVREVNGSGSEKPIILGL